MADLFFPTMNPTYKLQLVLLNTDIIQNLKLKKLFMGYKNCLENCSKGVSWQ